MNIHNNRRNIKATNSELTVELVAGLCVHATNARLNEDELYVVIAPLLCQSQITRTFNGIYT